MVIAPPLADLPYPLIRWQTVFVSTRPLAGESVQNGERCGIYATVQLQAGQIPFAGSRLFRNTAGWTSTAGVLKALCREPDGLWSVTGGAFNVR